MRKPKTMVKMKEQKGLLQGSDEAALRNFRRSGGSLKGSMKSPKKRKSVSASMALWGQKGHSGVF